MNKFFIDLMLRRGELQVNSQGRLVATAAGREAYLEPTKGGSRAPRADQIGHEN